MPRQFLPARSAGCASAALLAAFIAAPASAQPRVAASIMPIHSLVAGVMDGVGAPDLIVRGAASPHTYALKPSEARLLERARIVFWIGPVYESFLDKPLKSLAGRATIVGLMHAPGVALLATREGGTFEGDQDRRHGGLGHAADESDGHMFLDPENAKAMTRAIAVALAEADSANAGRYTANAGRIIDKIAALDRELDTALEPARGRPFLVFHDAYQYFEKRYRLEAAGSITVTPDRRPGVRRLAALRKKIAASEAICVFNEPQFEPSLAMTVTQGTTAKLGTLDPLGADLSPGPEAYFTLLRDLAKSLVGCLAS